MEEITKLVESGAGFSAIKAACDAVGINSCVMVCRGQGKMATNGVPSVIGSYPTVRHGQLDEFTVSTAKPGDVVKGNRYIHRVIANHVVRGDADMPSVMWWVSEVQQ
jgi:hypothetical protein